MGTLITYGSYIKKNDNLGSTAISVAGADTFIAVLAGMAIFPAIYAFADVEHLQVSQITDEGLVFITLPNILINMPGGGIFSTLFFILLAVAALTSTISVLEVIVAYFVEELGMLRRRATVIATASVSVLGIISVFFAGCIRFSELYDSQYPASCGRIFHRDLHRMALRIEENEEELSNSGKL